MRQKKAQAAMEFLMTYGWALLVVLIAIGALAFFGVLNPSRFLPETCVLAPGFACIDFKVTVSGVEVILQNGLGNNINIGSEMTIDAQELHGCIATATGIPQILDGKSQSITIDLSAAGCNSMTAGSKFKADMVFGYTPSGGTDHKKVGQIVAKIEAS